MVARRMRNDRVGTRFPSLRVKVGAVTPLLTLNHQLMENTMRYKPVALRGTALAAITGAVVAVSPAIAQSNYSQPTTTNPDNMSNAGNMTSEQPADQVNDPSSKLATDSVQDSSGQSVGTVRSISMGPNGRASRINVSLTRSGRTVSIRARELRFDPASNTLKSTLTLSQISAMPPATQSP